MNEAYLLVLEQLMEIVGEGVEVYARRLDNDVAYTVIVAEETSDYLVLIAAVLEAANDIHGFRFSFTAETTPNNLKYVITLYHLPIELDWIWNTVSPTPITLKTVVKKLKK